MANPLEKKIEFEEGKEPKSGRLKGKLASFRSRFFKMPSKKAILLLLLVLVLVFGFLTFALALPLMKVRTDLFALTQEGREIYTALQAQDLARTVEQIKKTNASLDQLEKDFKKLVWVKFIPFAGRYYKDAEHLLAGGGYLLEAADIAVESLKPYADILGLEGEEKKTMAEMTAEERLMLVLDTLDKIQPSLDKIGEKLDLARKEIDQIDPNRYPVSIGKVKIREKVVFLISTIDETAQAAIEIKPVVGYLKPLLGIPDEKKYLLLFQNDAELRPTGGFITAYALLSVHNGKFSPGASHDIYTLDARFGNRLKAPEPIEKYLPQVYYWHLRDMNLSPDFTEAMKLFWENASKVIGTGDIDGIIAVDTKFLVELMKVLGPIGVPEFGNFSAENDPRCNCPQIFYELERYADKPVGTLRAERKGIIGPLMHSILLNAMGSPRKKWPEFFNVGLSGIREKHLLFYFFEEEIQKGMEVLNASGRIKDFDDDYLHINDTNFAGAKSNMYIRVTVEQKIQISSDGGVTKTVIIDYKNPEPPSDCNIERGDLCLNGLYRDWVRLYVPKGSEFLESQGSEVEVKTYEDLGKTVFEAFYGKTPTTALRPLGKMQLTFKYKLPFKVEKGSEYKLLIQKQPGTYGYEYRVLLDGKEEEFELKTDRELRFRI